MPFVDDTDGIPLAPKLLGTYELELFPVVRHIARGDYDLIVNVGAGEGYYAVGLLALMPEVRSVVFEIGEKRRRLIGELAVLNGVQDRIAVHGWATADSLQSALERARRPSKRPSNNSTARWLMTPLGAIG